MVAARLRKYYDQQAKERQHQGQERGRQSQKGALVENLPPTETAKARDQAGEVLRVSGKTVDFATKVIENGPRARRSCVPPAVFDRLPVNCCIAAWGILARLTAYTPKRGGRVALELTRGRAVIG